MDAKLAYDRVEVKHTKVQKTLELLTLYLGQSVP